MYALWSVYRTDKSFLWLKCLCYNVISAPKHRRLNIRAVSSMRLGVLSDTHDEYARTTSAVEILMRAGAEVLVHCGDLMSPEIIRICAKVPFYFVFGNHDSDMVRILQDEAASHDAKCLGWGGSFQAADKRVAVVHGHLTMDVRPLLELRPDYLLSGHTHERHDYQQGATRRINPGALHRADSYGVAMLNTEDNVVQFLKVED